MNQISVTFLDSCRKETRRVTYLEIGESSLCAFLFLSIFSGDI